jgi:hypothetical protein
VSYYDNITFCSYSKDVPQGEHYAILFFGSSEDGYGGQRPCPTEYRVYKDRKSWEDAILEENGKPYHNGFVPLVANRPKIEVKINIQVTP